MAKTVQEWLGNDNQIGIDIWKNKYPYENESFDEWLNRICNGNEDLKELIITKKFLFGGRILSNRGLHKLGNKVTYSNCYVVSAPEDNIESIFDCAKALARTFSYGGGVGVDISKLAPNGAKVNNTAKKTSGAVSFMDLYSHVTELIGQNGRRGALMISLDCHHPDLENFIEIKSDLDKVTKANISIRVTNDFLEAVQNNTDFKLSFTRSETNEVIKKTIKAQEVFHKFCEMNWDYAEPAFLFWDRIEQWNLLAKTHGFKFAGTNPCAEEPLPAGGSCLLGSINLSEFVVNGMFDFDDFGKTVRIATRALNEVLDEGLPLHPLKEQRESVKNWRQIGLGIFGLADMLIKLQLTYGDIESLELCDKIGIIMINEAVKESAYLAREFGSYPKYNYEEVSNTEFYKYNIDTYVDSLVKKYGLRNSQLLTIAPTGSLSTMLGVSGGIEPIFANYYTRKTESLHDKEVSYKVYTPIVKQYIEENNLVDDNNLPKFFITAQDLNYRKRINMQSIWQSHIDASISSTINIPNEFTVEEVEDLYLYAWEQGLKGVTIFRDGCKRDGILTTNKNNKTEFNNTLNRGDILCVNDDLLSCKRTIINGCGKFYLHCDFDEFTGEPLETFIDIGSGGGCERNLQFISRLISLLLRAGVPVEEIIDQAMSIRPCKAYTDRTKSKGDTSKGTSCPSAIGYALKELQEKIHNRCFVDESESTLIEEINENNNPINYTNACPECGAKMQFEGGCSVCKECGFSHCG
ncbi:adenosylcobalamin-dependent ribonucleoside-diphosphate reductase [Anaerovorax sp. IOR16]|uniref:adenosylcobalamin-dependent ribonucleoside-diphosphate reductase n=1 Tax=Anaerovorax sp. IOR16 TaxID=2773458 RepID=UPI0019D1FB3D|nr:adenosylcobalamin-dependent ribonucleoside-diphosphate reductase [Anaerovorax sp. IOR16]